MYLLRVESWCCTVVLAWIYLNLYPSLLQCCAFFIGLTVTNTTWHIDTQPSEQATILKGLSMLKASCNGAVAFLAILQVLFHLQNSSYLHLFHSMQLGQHGCHHWGAAVPQQSQLPAVPTAVAVVPDQAAAAPATPDVSSDQVEADSELVQGDCAINAVTRTTVNVVAIEPLATNPLATGHSGWPPKRTPSI